MEKSVGAVPVPDPTELTTAALKEAIANVKELLLREITNEKEIRIEQIKAINVLKEEKFKELHERLDLIESRRLELKQDSMDALKAALAAQETLFRQQNECNEEAAAKSEASFAKQLEAISKEATLGRDGLSERLEALKERLDRGGGKEEQKTESRTESRATASWVVPVIVIGFIAAIGVILQIIALAPHVAR